MGFSSSSLANNRHRPLISNRRTMDTFLALRLLEQIAYKSTRPMLEITKNSDISNNPSLKTHYLCDESKGRSIVTSSNGYDGYDQNGTW